MLVDGRISRRRVGDFWSRTVGFDLTTVPSKTKVKKKNLFMGQRHRAYLFTGRPS